MTPGTKVTSAQKPSTTLPPIPMPPEGTVHGAELTASSTPHSPWVPLRKGTVAPGSHSKGKKEKLNLKSMGLSQCRSETLESPELNLDACTRARAQA